ncbi:MAG TPA: RHS repeat-associated core domain-containing protein, partial [Streptosporangiaceae bacterium]|nr:RHS repeat-associated core domain-containing protein [Streptosporangiaceae bacterium]
GAGETQSDKIAAWAYDTIKKGLPSSSTAYFQGAAFTQQVMGYNVYEQSEGTKTTVPSTTQTGALAGVYETQYGYDPDTGQLSSYYDTAGGGLPAETVNLGYDTQNDPVSVTSTIGDYVTSLSYTPLSQPQEYTLGTTNDPVQIDDSYDQQTGRLTGQDTVTGTSKTTVDDTQYNYNDVGDVTSEADTPSAGPAQGQCFQYQDYLGRLTQAWSQASSDCSSGPSQSAESGAAAPYWETYSYNAQNDLTGETSTPASGAATTVTNGYPSAGSAQPHAVASEQIAAPSGTTSSNYSYNADGDLTSVTGGSQSEALNWNDAGQLSSVTTTPPAGQAETTSYVYDASGNLLLQQDPSSVTLYLADEQLVLNTTSGTVSGTRYYSMNGATIAARTSTGQVSYLVGDEQGTSLVLIDASSLAVTRRYYDPYGNQIGSPPSAWPGTRGFVGGTADPSTGLTNLGAREYSPTTGSFISPDAIINPDDPQDLNAYAYASDNPSTLEDPSGNMFTEGTGPPRTCIGSSACDGRLGNGASSSQSDYSGGDDSSPGGYSSPFPGYGGFPSPASPSYVRSAERSHTVIPAIALMPGPKPARKVITNGSTGESACSPMAVHLGVYERCYVPQPKNKKVMRAPDYLTGEFSWAGAMGPLNINGVSVSFSITRHGDVYVSIAAGPSVPGAMAAVRAGWLDQAKPPPRKELQSFMSGQSESVGGYLPVFPDPGGGIIGPDVTETWGNLGQSGFRNFATETGVGVGVGHDVSGGEGYAFHIGRLLGW